MRYYKQRYTASNMVLVVGGAFDEADITQHITRTFGTLPRKAPPELETEKEPKPFSNRVIEKSGNTSTTYWSCRFSTVDLYSQDLYTLDLLEFILGNGEDSLLYRTIVDEKKLAFSVRCSSYTPSLTNGYFDITVDADYNNLEKIKEAVLNILARIKNGDIEDKFLEKAKKQKLSDDIFSIVTMEDRVSRAGQSVMYGHTLDFYGNEMRVNKETFISEQHSVDFFTEKALDYISNRSDFPSQPFFLLIPYNGPYGHWPSIKGPAKNQFWENYAGTSMTSVPREGINKEAIQLYDLQKNLSGPGGPDFSSLLQMPNDLTSLRNYYSQMSVIDHGVGQVMHALEHNGFNKNTLVIFTADHGFSLGHHGFWGHGQATWPSNAFRIAYNIPLLMWAPDMIEQGQVRQEFVSSMDLYATVLDFLELMEKTEMNSIPSKSFADLLNGTSNNWRNEIYIEQEETRAIRTPDWSYFKRFKGSNTFPLENELYDLTADPDERINLAGETGSALAERSLTGKLDSYFDTYADPRFDLWNGGTVKSNTSRPWLWKDAWGAQWSPIT